MTAEYKKIFLWVVVPILIALDVIFAGWMIAVHGGDSAAAKFVYACGLALAFLMPWIAFLLTGRIAVVAGAKRFGGAYKMFWTTLICTIGVILPNVLINMGRQLSFQVEPWQIYTYYVVISISEESFYRMMLCQGIMMLMNARNRVLGFTGAGITIALGYYSSYLTGSTVTELIDRITWVLITGVVFIVFFIFTKKRDEPAPIWISAIAVFVSASSFMLVHWKVYGEYPDQMAALFIGGVSLAAMLIYTRNPFVPFAAHFLNNLSALRGIVVN